jgi:CHASE1-domain containing sensor protein
MLISVRRRGTTIAVAEVGRGRYPGLLSAAAVIVVGLTTTVLAVAGLRGAQGENADRVMDQRSDMVRAAVRAETERYRSMVDAVAAGLATDDGITWEDFDKATASLDTARLTGAADVALVAPSGTADIAATQRLWRGRGAEGLVLRPAGDRDEHYFTIFTRPLRDGAARDGLDLAAASEPANALVDARRMSRPTVSESYVLLRDRNLPASQQQRSFVFAAPIWPSEADPVFRGWIVLGVRGGDLLTGVLATASQDQLDAELLAPTDRGEWPVVAAYAVSGGADLRRTRLVDVADREWVLITEASSGRLPGARSSLPVTVLVGGLALTLMLAGLVVLATGRSRARLVPGEAASRRPAATAERFSEVGTVSTNEGRGDDETRARLERALAERAAAESMRLPPGPASPAGVPAARPAPAPPTGPG